MIETKEHLKRPNRTLSDKQEIRTSVTGISSKQSQIKDLVRPDKRQLAYLVKSITEISLVGNWPSCKGII